MPPLPVRPEQEHQIHMHCSPAIYPSFRRHLRISFAASFLVGLIFY